MQTITQADVQKQIDLGETYYRNRWGYLSHVVEMVHRVDPKTVVELGPYKMPICSPSDTIDRKESLNPTHCFDASVTPWPIDQKYDLFIATQVFEHLGINQSAAFSEACRIAGNVLISLPYRWNCPHDKIHHGIGDEKIAEWTNHQKPLEFKIVGHRIRRWIGLF